MKKLLVIFLTLLLFVQSLSLAGGVGYPASRSRTACSVQSLFLNQALMEPLFSPLLSNLRIRVTSLRESLRIHIGKWMPLTASLAFLPAILAQWHAGFSGSLDPSSSFLVLGMISPRIDLMKEIFKALKSDCQGKPERIWEAMRGFLTIINRGKLAYSKPRNIEEHVARQADRKDERAFMRWVRQVGENAEEPQDRDVELAKMAAVMDIELYGLPLIDTGYGRDTRRAFRFLQKKESYEALLSIIAYEPGDFVILSNAVDAVQSLNPNNQYYIKFILDKLKNAGFKTSPPGEEEGLTDFIPSHPEPPKLQVAAVPDALPLMARLNWPFTKTLIQNEAVVARAQQRLGLSTTQTTEVALRLLAFEEIPVQDVTLLLRDLLDRNDRLQMSGESPAFMPAPSDRDLYIMVCMLAALQVHRQSPAGRTILTPRVVRKIQEEITNRHWSAPEYGFLNSISVAKVAGKLGELIQEPEIPGGVENLDPAIQVMMGYLFEMQFKETAGVLFDKEEREKKAAGLPFDLEYREKVGMLSLREIKHPALLDASSVNKARQTSQARGNAALAARFQFTLLAQALKQFHTKDFTWDKAYRLGKWQIHFSREKPELQSIAKEITLRFGTPQSERGARKKSQKESVKGKLGSKTWPLFVPTARTDSSDEEEDLDFVIPFPIDQHVGDMSADDIYEAWETKVIPVMFSRKHFTAKAKTLFNKYGVFIHQWDDLVDIIFKKNPKRDIAIYQLEIDPTQYCNNDCEYCHGLRDVPKVTAFLAGEKMIKAVKEAHAKNPKHLFVRISSVIGEPLLNRGTLMLIEYMNNNGIPYGVITNGLLPYAGKRTDPDRYAERWDWVLNLVYAPKSSMEFMNISVDAGSNEGYYDLKHPAFAKFYGVTPYDYVTDNGHLAVEMRNRTRSKSALTLSAVIQEKNYDELDKLAARAKYIGADQLQMKAQGLDPNRTMWPESIRDLYLVRKKVFDALKTDTFEVVWLFDFETVNSQNEAARTRERARHLVLYKDGKPIKNKFISLIPEEMIVCIVQLMAPVLSPFGDLMPCRNAYLIDGVRPTLDALGNAIERRVDELTRERQQNIWNHPVQAKCVNCAPSDWHINYIFMLMIAASNFPGLLERLGQLVQEHAYIEQLQWEMATQAEQEGGLASALVPMISGTLGYATGHPWSAYLLSAAAIGLHLYRSPVTRARIWQDLMTEWNWISRGAQRVSSRWNRTAA